MSFTDSLVHPFIGSLVRSLSCARILSCHFTMCSFADGPHNFNRSWLLHLKNRFLIEGSLEVKLPTIWTDEKQSRAEAERRERLEERRSEEKESEERRCRCAKM